MTKACTSHKTPSTPLAAPAWSLYNKLIDAIPDNIVVIEACQGTHWSYVWAECGMGVAATCTGGCRQRLEGVSGWTLKQLAKLIYSWDFEAASLGLAAINAWHNQATRFKKLDNVDVFDSYLDTPTPDSDPFVFAAKELTKRAQKAPKHPQIVTIGHFPSNDKLKEAGDLYVLERSMRDGDLPDSACDYILPLADLSIITGMTLSNKTLPHLLDLTRQNPSAETIVTGPSTTLSDVLFEHGATCLAGSYVVKPELIKEHLLVGGSPLSSGGLCTCTIKK